MLADPGQAMRTPWSTAIIVKEQMQATLRSSLVVMVVNRGMSVVL